MLVAASATLTEVALSLYQVAITGSGGANPNDLVLLLTTIARRSDGRCRDLRGRGDDPRQDQHLAVQPLLVGVLGTV